MKIEVWSDFVCPFCYIGKRRLEEAVDQLPNKDKVEIEYKSFELDPNAKVDYHEDIHSVLATKYGTSYEQGKEMNNRMGEHAKEVGLTYNFDTMIPTNSFDAHRLLHYAADHGKQAEIKERVLYAYFTESKKISDHETLADLAAEVGLNRAEVLDMLKDTEYTEAVRMDEQEGQALGIQGVPFFVINRKYAISGAQPLQVFVDALEKVREEEAPLTFLSNPESGATNDAVCTDDSCKIPGTEEK